MPGNPSTYVFQNKTVEKWQEDDRQIEDR